MTTLEELAQAIELGHPNETEELVRKALEEGTDPVVLVEEVMVPAMRVVGEKYKEQQETYQGYFLPQEVCRRALRQSKR